MRDHTTPGAFVLADEVAITLPAGIPVRLLTGIHTVHVNPGLLNRCGNENCLNFI